MYLTKKDIQTLKEWGHEDSDIRQLNEAANKTKYEVDGESVSRDTAIQLLGRRCWLSGIARSAFHWTAARETEDGKTVFFDSSALFQ